MKREIKSEIVTVRLTPTERDRINEMGGAAEVLRRALRPHWPETLPAGQTLAASRSFMVWQDGSVGPSWPALASS